MHKKHFPIFSFYEEQNKPLIYLDSAATTHKPKCVIDSVSNFYAKEYGTVDRTLYTLGYEASDKVEGVRQKVASFINCKKSEVIFTQSVTYSINMLALSYCEKFMNPGDEIMLCAIEHHSNYLPWTQIAKKKGYKIIFYDLDEFGEIELKKYEQKFSERTKLVISTHVSNVLGRQNPIKKMAKIAHARDCHIVCDGAQSVGHHLIDFKDLDVDFFAFSAHKMYGPTGVGVLAGKESLLEMMDPCFYGGSMIERIDNEELIFRDSPYKFECGTPMIASIIGLGGAINFLQSVDREQIMAHEQELSCMLFDSLSGHVKFLSENCRGSSILTFTSDMHPTDAAMMLCLDNICIRSGNMCAQPLFKHFGIESAIRVSIGMYNTKSDIETFTNKLTSLALV